MAPDPLASETASADHSQKQISFDLPGIAWRRRWLLAAGLLLGLLAGIGYCSWRGPEYESTAQLLVLKKRLDTTPIT